MSKAINQAGLNLVKEFEGFYSKAYLCPAGVWTIGYGHTDGVKKGQVISLEQAEEYLLSDLAKAGEAVQRLITLPLTGNQYAALVSFTFNVGSGNLRESTLRRKLNAGDYDAVPFELSRWVKARDPKTKQKVTLRGLVRRRAAEADLWLTDAKISNAMESTGGMAQEVEKA